VLFADCRGYTRLTHDLGIEKLAPITEEFFKTSAEIIRDHHGIVDHFLGDAMMALFNVPIKHDDHVLRAVGAAFRIQEAVERINTKRGGGVLLGVGIGIATGTALATNMGSTNCNDYTMVGDSINIASRLQGKAGTGEILVTAEAYKAIRAAFPVPPPSNTCSKGFRIRLPRIDCLGRALWRDRSRIARVCVIPTQSKTKPQRELPDFNKIV
jgi:adenylate cyclase